METIPSFYKTRPMEANKSDPRRWSGLYVGTILGTILPDDPHSLTKKFIEYRVAAQAYLDGVAATIEFPHAILMNPLAGFADKSSWTLRADSNAIKKGVQSVGSKVLILCINSDQNNAVIIGGIRDQADKDVDTKDTGHHMGFTFNGIDISIDKNGALELRRNGPTKPDGKLNEDLIKKENVGQVIRLDKDGGIALITTKDNKDDQKIVFDHPKQTLTVHTTKALTVEVQDGPMSYKSSDVSTQEAKAVIIKATGGDVTINAPSGKILLGANANEPAVLGQTLVTLLGQLLTALQSMTVSTAVGPSSPPLNSPLFAQLQSQLSTALSTGTFVKRSP